MKQLNIIKHIKRNFVRYKAIVQAHFMYLRFSKEQLIFFLGAVFTFSNAIDLLNDDEGKNIKIKLFLISFCLFIFGYLIYCLFIKYRFESKNTVILSRYNYHIRNQLYCGEHEDTDGYEIRQFKYQDYQEYYIESSKINSALSNGVGIKLIANERKYIIPDEIKSYVPAILDKVMLKNKYFFNGKLLRQASHLGFQSENEFMPVVVQKTDYFSGQCTHEIVYHTFLNATSINKRFEGYKLLMNNNGQVFDLNESYCANFIGASTIVVTADHKMVIGRQGYHSMANAGRFAPSGSGSVSYSDYINYKKQKKTD